MKNSTTLKSPHPVLNVKNYIKDGFARVCTVQSCSSTRWFYQNINQKLMFDTHKSWLYFVVVKNTIVKIGETGNPLGIRLKDGDQPRTGSVSRLGRLSTGDMTDRVIREELCLESSLGHVSIWAKRCEMIAVPVLIGGQAGTTVTSYHKDLEMRYLDLIVEQTGHLPLLNKARK